jgi:site-specific DNA recombinase
MTTKAIGYIRVSTDKQAERGMSIEIQRAKILGYAQIMDIEIVDIIVDSGQSAKTLDRPGLQKALAMLKGKKPAAGALIVAKLDRLTRSVKDLGELVDGLFSKKATLLSVADQIDTRTAAGRMILNMIGTIAQWERETIGERTKAAMQHKKAQGEYCGGRIPFGYDLVNGQLMANTAEQFIIRRAQQLRALGQSFRKIAAALAKQDLFSRLGKIFEAMQIRAMCINTLFTAGAVA